MIECLNVMINLLLECLSIINKVLLIQYYQTSIISITFVLSSIFFARYMFRELLVTNSRSLFSSQVSLKFLFTMTLISLGSFRSIRVKIRVLCLSIFVVSTYVRAIPHHHKIYVNQPHRHFEL